VSARAWSWRLFISWSRWPWLGWRPRRLAAPISSNNDYAPRWWKAYRFPGPCEIYYAALSLGWGHVWITIERTR